MPTGYTAGIEDGEIKTGKEFLMNCARAFGACISLRDEPFSAPIPEKFEPDSYEVRRLAETAKELEKYNAMTMEEAEIESTKEHENRIRIAKEEIAKEAVIAENYKKILNEVNQWIPPTSEHHGLKKFAIEQIMMCYGSFPSSYWTKTLKEPKQTAREWLYEKTYNAEESVKRAQESYIAAVNRAEERTRWVADLRNSL